MTDTPTPCKRGCCWTPYGGICPHGYQCIHHQVDDSVLRFRDELIAASEVNRDANRVAAA